MKGKIALEEHFAIDDTLQDSAGFLPDAIWTELSARLLDIHGKRLRQMDEHGIEMMLLSLNAPVIQAIPAAARANDIARRANDYLAREVQKRPDRFQGLAALPMQDPDLAIRELERCIGDFGFKGALVNGFSQVGDPDNAVYYDLPQYRPFWAAVEQLGVPFYLHPRSPLPRDARLYDGHPWMLGAAWAFGNETAVHALRLMGSGLFDEFPRLAIIIGHMGECIPFGLWRIDNCNLGAQKNDGKRAKRKIADYFLANFYVTTSGHFSTQALIHTIMQMGSDRVMFSADWPFEEIAHAAVWFDAADISENDRRKIGRTNAARLLKLKLA
jgi:2,3-dihydroxybenzoate decarboxylase